MIEYESIANSSLQFTGIVLLGFSSQTDEIKHRYQAMPTFRRITHFQPGPAFKSINLSQNVEKIYL